MTRCLLGIGSNLGDRAAQMDSAVEGLSRRDDVDVITVSEWMETTPVGGPEKQQSYLNGAIVIDTDLSAPSLLSWLLDVERGLGRERELRWGPRSVDLDLLLYGDQCINEPGLTVPHPWMAIRRFVIEPAESVAAEMVHPTTGWSLKKLSENLQSRPIMIAVDGIQTADQLTAIQAAAAESAARTVRLEEILKKSDRGAEEFAKKIRGVLAGETSAVSESATELESLRNEIREDALNALRIFEEQSKKVAETAGASDEVAPILCDFWWGRCFESGSSVLPTPNLLVTLGDSSGMQHQPKSTGNDDGYCGPRLVLAGDDLKRLQHDVTAAVEGMH